MTEPAAAPADKIEPPRPLSDKSQLLWQRYYVPMQAAAAAFNAAVQNTQGMFAEIILGIEGVSKETHIFDADNMRIIPRPVIKPE